MTQPSKVGRSGAMPGDATEYRDIVSRHSIDNGQPRIDAGPVLGIDSTVNRRREHDAARVPATA